MEYKKPRPGAKPHGSRATEEAQKSHALQALKIFAKGMKN